MTDERAISIAQYVFGAVGGVLIWTLRKAFWAGGMSSDVENRIKSLEKRMEQAGHEMSEFATDLQGATERYRRVFTTIDQHNDLKDVVRKIDEKIDRLHEFDTPFPNNRRRKP